MLDTLANLCLPGTGKLSEGRILECLRAQKQLRANQSRPRAPKGEGRAHVVSPALCWGQGCLCHLHFTKEEIGSEKGVICPLEDDSESHANRTRREYFAPLFPHAWYFLGSLLILLGQSRGLLQCPTSERGLRGGEQQLREGEPKSFLQFRARPARGRMGLRVCA